MQRGGLYATLALVLTFVLGVPLGILLLLDPAASAQCGTQAGPGPSSVTGIPQNLLPMFEGAAQQSGLGPDGWAYLAALNYAESTFATSTQPGVGGESNQHSGRTWVGGVVYGSGLRRRWLPRGPGYQQQAGGGAHYRSPFRASHGRVLHPGRLTRMIAPWKINVAEPGRR
jgi:hypothetical protein